MLTLKQKIYERMKEDVLCIRCNYYIKRSLAFCDICVDCKKKNKWLIAYYIIPLISCIAESIPPIITGSLDLLLYHL